MMPGNIAAAKRSVTGISRTGPMTTSMIEGGMRMPSVPPAVIVPEARRTSYPERFIVVAAMMPRMVTLAPTIPVAAPNITLTNRTATKSDPFIRASMSCTAANSRSISPACSIMNPMKTNSGTAASVCSIIEP